MRLRFLAPLVGVLLLASQVVAQDAPKYPPTKDVRAAFLKLLDRPRVPLDAKVASTKTLADGSMLEEITFASEKKADGGVERVPTLVLRPAGAKGKLPAVVVLHGTGGSRHGVLDFMKDLAKRGIVGVAIDARYHGDRVGASKGAAGYNEAIAKAWRVKAGEPMEHPFYYDTVWDLWRLADYLESRPDLDARNLGMIGFSMGGVQCWLAASVDERYKVAVPAIAVQSFRWSLENNQWQGRANTIKLAHLEAARDLGETAINEKVCTALWNKVIPGILDQHDCPSMLRLFADRPLLVVAGTKDPNTPLGGLKLAIASAEQEYAKADAKDRLRVILEDVGHTVTPLQRSAALDWFERWLK